MKNRQKQAYHTRKYLTSANACQKQPSKAQDCGKAIMGENIHNSADTTFSKNYYFSLYFVKTPKPSEFKFHFPSKTS
jgi:hypothetical protein